jgi:sensor domain CHASE-containing protein
MVEQRDAEGDVARVRTALADYILQLEGKAGDWSQWDEAYAFIANPTQEWLDTNVPTNSLVQLDLNLVAFIDTAGRIVHVKAVDATTGNSLPVPSPFNQPIPAGSPLLRHDQGLRGLSGITLVDGRCLLVAARPIVTSAGQGPARGTLIFGRFLDEGLADRIHRSTDVALAFQPYEGTLLPADFRAAREALDSLDAVHVAEIDGEQLAAFGLVGDLAGRPATVLRVVSPREMRQIALETLWYAIAAVVVVGVVFGVAMLLIVGRLLRRGEAQAAPPADSPPSPTAAERRSPALKSLRERR